MVREAISWECSILKLPSCTKRRWERCSVKGVLLWTHTGALRDGNENDRLRVFSREVTQLHEEMVREMIGRDRNHPSVIMWSMANEPHSADKEAREHFRSVLPSFLCSLQVSHKLFSQISNQRRPLTWHNSTNYHGVWSILFAQRRNGGSVRCDLCQSILRMVRGYRVPAADLNKSLQC